MITLSFSWNFRIILMFERKHFKSQISDLILAWIYNFVKMWLFVRMLNCKFGFQDTFCFWSVYLIQIYCLIIFLTKPPTYWLLFMFLALDIVPRLYSLRSSLEEETLANAGHVAPTFWEPQICPLGGWYFSMYIFECFWSITEPPSLQDLEPVVGEIFLAE
jgi:hypothetical protein